ncbi:MAG: toprim domain-containing protein [Pseudomonadota bacterium]
MAWNCERAAAVIVESELDGLLLNQEVGDLAGVVTMGTAQAKPDMITHEGLTVAAVILVSLDTDDAGAKAAWSFWLATYGKRAKRWPSVKGKDASDARLNGLDLRAWITTGIFTTEDRFERFSIMTVDGGLTDNEAMKALEATT